MKYFVFAFVLLFCSGCSGNDKNETPGPSVEIPDIEFKDGVFEKRGSGSFVYTGYKPLSDKPITLYYYIPTRGDIEEMPVLFSMHGAERSGTTQRDAWKYFAEEFQFVVLAPEYSKTYYKENDYQFGGLFVSADSDELNPEELWTYRTVEAIFDYFKRETGNLSATYHMFGHSAGGQFVHRYLLAMPEARVGRAVAANPGSWTWPCEGIEGTDGAIYGWPYSVASTPFADEEHLRNFFSRKLYVQIGTADTDPDDSSLPVGPAAMAQGACRYERGVNFCEACREVAARTGWHLSFVRADVEGVGHSTLRMVYGKPTVSNPAATDDRGQNSAFDLLFYR